MHRQGRGIYIFFYYIVDEKKERKEEGNERIKFKTKTNIEKLFLHIFVSIKMK